MHKTYTVGTQYRTKTIENSKISDINYPTLPAMDHNVRVELHDRTDKDVMKLEMQVLFIFIFRKK